MAALSSFLFIPKDLVIRASFKGKNNSVFAHELKHLDMIAGTNPDLIDHGEPIYRKARQLESNNAPNKQDVISYFSLLLKRFSIQIDKTLMSLLFSTRHYSRERAFSAQDIFIHAKGLTFESKQYRPLSQLLISRCEYDLKLVRSVNRKEWHEWGDLLKTQLLVPEYLVDKALNQLKKQPENINLKLWGADNMTFFYSIIICRILHSLALAERFSLSYTDKKYTLDNDKETCFSVLAKSFQDESSLKTVPAKHFIDFIIKKANTKSRRQFCQKINITRKKNKSDDDHLETIYKRYTRWGSGDNPISHKEIYSDFKSFGSQPPRLSIYAVNFLTKLCIELREKPDISNIFHLCPPYQKFRDLISYEYEKFT